MCAGLITASTARCSVRGAPSPGPLDAVKGLPKQSTTARRACPFETRSAGPRGARRAAGPTPSCALSPTCPAGLRARALRVLGAALPRTRGWPQRQRSTGRRRFCTSASKAERSGAPVAQNRINSSSLIGASRPSTALPGSAVVGMTWQPTRVGWPLAWPRLAGVVARGGAEVLGSPRVAPPGRAVSP